MARYKLLEPHYLNERLLEAGVEVGDGTSIPFIGRPSAYMEGVDDEGKKKVEDRLKTFLHPNTSLPIKMEAK